MPSVQIMQREWIFKQGKDKAHPYTKGSGLLERLSETFLEKTSSEMNKNRRVPEGVIKQEGI